MTVNFTMDKILSEFGVQPVLLAAQVVNFLILLFILKKFLYGPILKALEVRKSKIAESLKNAEEIEQRLNAISEEEQKRILKAGQDAEKIIKEAQETGLLVIEEAKIKAESLADRIAKEANNQLQLEKEKLSQEMKEHLADLVAEGLKTITGKVLTDKDKKEIVSKSIKGIS